MRRRTTRQQDTNSIPASIPIEAGQQRPATPGQPPDDKRSSVLEPTKVEQVGGSSSRKATGPRTPQGKQHSKYNALKHGKYSKKLVLQNESPAEFRELWDGLWDDLQPQGTLATEIFVDIVWNRWSKRRFLRAKNAQIAEAVEFSELDRSEAQEVQAWNSERYGGSLGGMLTPGCNPFVLRKGIEILQQIRHSVETSGFNAENDRRLLRNLYGTDTDGRPLLGVFDLYILLAACASVAKEGEEDTDPEKLKKVMLEAVDKEIGNLTALNNALLDLNLKRRTYRVEQALVPSQVALDRDMSQETHSTRDLARLLTLFEYAQRMHKGNQVSPPSKLDVSS